VLEDEGLTVTSWAREAGAKTTKHARSKVPARAIEAGRVVRSERMLIQFLLQERLASGLAISVKRWGQNARVW
jgi:hypothetical protein